MTYGISKMFFTADFCVADAWSCKALFKIRGEQHVRRQDGYSVAFFGREALPIRSLLLSRCHPDADTRLLSGVDSTIIPTEYPPEGLKQGWKPTLGKTDSDL